MSKYKVGDKVYRRTINNKVLTSWEIVSIGKRLFYTEYYLKKDIGIGNDLIIIDKERNLFPAFEQPNPLEEKK